MGEGGLPDPGRVLDQKVTSGQQAGQALADLSVLPTMTVPI
jgi:hypothetical protein